MIYSLLSMQESSVIRMGWAMRWNWRNTDVLKTDFQTGFLHRLRLD